MSQSTQRAYKGTFSIPFDLAHSAAFCAWYFHFIAHVVAILLLAAPFVACTNGEKRDPSAATNDARGGAPLSSTDAGGNSNAGSQSTSNGGTAGRTTSESSAGVSTQSGGGSPATVACKTVSSDSSFQSTGPTCIYNGLACQACPSDCCTGYAVDGICQNCTQAGNACKTGNCGDCCSGQSLAGKCIDCVSNADCGCPLRCLDNACAKTPDQVACAYPDCSDCDSGKSANGVCLPQCTTDADCGQTQNCVLGRCQYQVSSGSGGTTSVAANGGATTNSGTGGSSVASTVTSGGTAGSTGTCPSTQKLCSSSCVDIAADTTNCGSCGNLCAPSATCVTGQCNCSDGACPTVLTANLGSTPKSLLVDSSNLYWIAPSTGNSQAKIKKLVKAVGNVETMFEMTASSSLTYELQAMTQTTDYLYATWVGCGTSSCSGGVLQLRKDGSTSSYLTGSTAYIPTGVAATDAAVYWIDRGQNSYSKGISVLSPPTSGTSAQVVPWSGESLLLITNTLFFTSCGVPSYNSPCSIGSLSTSGGTSTNLSASTQSAIPSVTTNGIDAYWTECAGGLYRASPGSGATRQVVVPGVKCSPLAVDETNAYLVDGSLWRTPLDGSNRTALFTIQSSSAVAVDDSHVYVASSWQGGSILSAQK